MLSFLSLVLLASIRSMPKRSAIPSRHHSPTNPLGPSAQTTEMHHSLDLRYKTKQHVILLKRLNHEEDWGIIVVLQMLTIRPRPPIGLTNITVGGKLTRGSNNTNIGRVDHLAGGKVINRTSKRCYIGG